MSPKICGENQFGPVRVFARENSISSFDPAVNAFQFNEECLDASYDKAGNYGVFTTKYFKARGVPFGGRRFDGVWWEKNPKMTDPRFDLIFTTYTLNAYISQLSALNVYQGGLENVFLKPFEIDVSTQDFPNAVFMQGDYSIMLGMVKNACAFGGDADVIAHEFSHLLTYSRNRQLGSLFNDTEGSAMHEAISDVQAMLFNNGDKEIAEPAVICLGIGDKEGPDIGMRTVSVPQPNLPGLYSEEEHLRSEMYAPFLDSCFERLVKLCGGDRETARQAMFIIVHRMAEFLPARPQKRDFARALYNSLIDLTHRPDFGVKYKFKPEEFTAEMLKAARPRGIITSADDERYAVTPYPYIKDAAAEVRGREDAHVKFEELYKRGNIAFYRQMRDGVPVDGAGLAFVNTLAGIQMIEQVSRESFKLPAEPIDPRAAWEGMIKSAETADGLKKLLEAQVKMGVLDRHAVESIFLTMKDLPSEGMPKMEVFFVPGKKNAHYRFESRGAVTFFVDSGDGSVTFARRAFL